MGLNYNPASVIDGLVYYLDIMNTRCYSGTGNTLYNLANSAIGTTIVSGITTACGTVAIKIARPTIPAGKASTPLFLAKL